MASGIIALDAKCNCIIWMPNLQKHFGDQEYVLQSPNLQCAQHASRAIIRHNIQMHFQGETVQTFLVRDEL